MDYRFALATVVVAAFACDTEDCDAGFTATNGVCFEDPTGSGGSGDGTGGVATGGASGGASSGGASSGGGPAGGAPSEDGLGLGETCTANDQCASDNPLCAIQPSQSEGYCTVAGCGEGVECPEGATCLNFPTDLGQGFCLLP